MGDAVPFFVESAKLCLGLLVFVVEGDEAAGVAGDFRGAHLLGDFVEALFGARDVGLD